MYKMYKKFIKFTKMYEKYIFQNGVSYLYTKLKNLKKINERIYIIVILLFLNNVAVHYFIYLKFLNIAIRHQNT